MDIITTIIIIAFLYWEYSRMWKNSTKIREELRAFEKEAANEITAIKFRLEDLDGIKEKWLPDIPGEDLDN